MAAHNLLGKVGEDEAVKYLISHQYVIRSRNWRSGHKELDIVAEKDGELIVIEVKTRKNSLFAMPQDAVDARKIKHTVLATDAYLRHFSIDLPVRFDIITLVGTLDHFTLEHIKEAFYPPIC